MYTTALDLVKEILADEELNECCKELTGKNLTTFTSGPRLNTPAAVIEFGDAEIRGKRENTVFHVVYNITFVMSFFGSDGFEKCHLFLDNFIKVALNYESEKDDKKVYVIRVDPTMVEKDPEKDWWGITVRIVVGCLD